MSCSSRVLLLLLLLLTFLPSCSSYFILFHVVSSCFFFLSMASMLPCVAKQRAIGKMTFQPAAAMPIIEPREPATVEAKKILKCKFKCLQRSQDFYVSLPKTRYIISNSFHTWCQVVCKSRLSNRPRPGNWNRDEPGSGDEALIPDYFGSW